MEIMDYTFYDISKSDKLKEQAAVILHTAFTNIGKCAWLTIEAARKEVAECSEPANICMGMCRGDTLLGWAGLRPMYDKTWELHPMVMHPDYQHLGLGRKLLKRVEEGARKLDIVGILLGTDDETGGTSLSQCELTADTVFDEIRNIRNLKKHPYEFYQKCGYAIIGAVPDASGIGKPDILMWKSLLQDSSG
jgi:aminoglycoside 6'-N-acetyltransferase I